MPAIMVNKTLWVRAAIPAATRPAHIRWLPKENPACCDRIKLGMIRADSTAAGTKRRVLWRLGLIVPRPKSQIKEKRMKKVPPPMIIMINHRVEASMVTMAPFVGEDTGNNTAKGSQEQTEVVGESGANHRQCAGTDGCNNRRTILQGR